MNVNPFRELAERKTWKKRAEKGKGISFSFTHSWLQKLADYVLLVTMIDFPQDTEKEAFRVDGFGFLRT